MTEHKTLEELTKVATVSTTLTRKQKLLRWAVLVRKHPEQVTLYTGLEYVPAHLLGHIRAHGSAAAIAASDPVLKDAGLKSDDAHETMRFFELNPNELHFISCDCSGHISNAAMAERITSLANSRK